MKIYLAGSMSGMTWEQQNSWRVSVKNELLKRMDLGGYNLDLTIVNPCEFFNYLKPENKFYSEKEAMDFDLHQVRNTDIILVNFNNPKSIGTAMELMLAKELNIPVVGIFEFNNTNDCFEEKIKESIHPWLIECCIRILPNQAAAIDYIETFYFKSFAKENLVITIDK